MKITKLAVAVSAAFAFSSAALADITIGVSLSATGPAAMLGIPEKNVLTLIGLDERSRVLVRIEKGAYKLVAN